MHYVDCSNEIKKESHSSCLYPLELFHKKGIFSSHSLEILSYYFQLSPHFVIRKKQLPKMIL